MSRKSEYKRVLEATKERIQLLERCYKKVAEAVVKYPKDAKGLQIVEAPLRLAFYVYRLYHGTRVVFEGTEASGIVAGDYISGDALEFEVKDPSTLEEVQRRKFWEKFGNRTFTVALYKDALGREIARFKTVPEEKKANYDYLILI